MTPPHLKIITVDPGGTSGVCLAQVPRLSIYGDQPGEWQHLECREVAGDEDEQADAIARMAREFQSLDYMLGPAIVCEDFDNENPFQDDYVFSPIRIAAKIEYAIHRGWAGDARFYRQKRGMAFSIATNKRLMLWGMREYYRGSEHKKDALRHMVAITRRAKQSPSLRAKLWNHV